MTRASEPTSVSSWHEYYRDPNKVEVFIKYRFNIPSKVRDFNMDVDHLHVRQDHSTIHVTYRKFISQALLSDIQQHFEDFKQNRDSPQDLIDRNPSRYIVGFLKDTLPKINEEIFKRRYQEGHLILRNISLFDVEGVFVMTKQKQLSAVLWPLPLPNFEDIPAHVDVIFVRDLIDAMSEYFYFNLDECIRKVITSLENYFIYYNLSDPSPNERGSKMKRLVNGYVTENQYTYKERDLSILRDNILFVYTVRNKIVHDKLRLHSTCTVFCKKAIDTLLYIYQSSYTTNDGKRQPIFMLNGQFKMIDGLIAPNLDRFDWAERNTKEPTLIRNNDELDASMFRSLAYKDNEKKEILNIT